MAAAAVEEPFIAADKPVGVELVEGKDYYWYELIMLSFDLCQGPIFDLPSLTDRGRCRCGLSKKQPFCDGSVSSHMYNWISFFFEENEDPFNGLVMFSQHAGTSFTPLKFTATKTGTAYLCNCKQTKKAPYCDVWQNILSIINCILIFSTMFGPTTKSVEPIFEN